MKTNQSNISIENHILLEITNRCPFRCKHCFTTKEFFNKPSLNSEMNAMEIKNILDEFYSIGIDRVTISGGEPSLRPDLEEICEYSSRRGFQTYLFSSVLNEDRIKELKKYVLLFGVSYDGPPKVHNDLRQNPFSYKLTFNTIKFLKANKVNFSVQSMVTPFSLNRVEWIVRRCEKFSAISVRLSHVSPQGRSLNYPEIFLSLSQMKLFWSKVSKLRRTTKIVIFTNLVDKSTFFNEKERITSFVFHIKPNGILLPLLGIEKYMLGNLLKTPIKVLLDKKSTTLYSLKNKIDYIYRSISEKIKAKKWNFEWIPFEDTVIAHLEGIDFIKLKRISYLQIFLK